MMITRRCCAPVPSFTLIGITIVCVLGGGRAAAQSITEIIDAIGDGAGNTLISPVAIGLDTAGNVYVVDKFGDNVFKIATPDTCCTITTSGCTACTITEIIDATGDGAGNTLDAPTAIAVDGSDNVYVTGADSNNAFKITPAGVITEIIDATGDGAGNTLAGPSAIAVDDSGNVYVAGRDGNNAFKITPAGVITEIIDVTGDGAGNILSATSGIAVDGSGNVFVTGQSSINAFKITSAGVITEIIDIDGAGPPKVLAPPSAIAADAAGNAYVAGGSAFKITPAGVITEIIECHGDGTGDCIFDGEGNSFIGPTAITVDALSNVYVTANDSYNAFKITAAGAITEIINAYGDGSGGGHCVDPEPAANPFCGAGAIAIDPATGDAYVSGRGSVNAFRIPQATFCPPPEVLSAESEKFHQRGFSAGAKYIPAGDSECRNIGGTLNIIIKFDEAVFSEDGDGLVPGDFTVENGTVQFVSGGATKLLTITNVGDAECFTISFVAQGITGNRGLYAFEWPILLGDADNNGEVEVADKDLLEGKDGKSVWAPDFADFRCDLNFSGKIQADPEGDDSDLDLVTTGSSASCP